jgi:hypothetical protein
MTHLVLITCWFLTQTASQVSPASPVKVHKIAVSGEGGWD